jgi:hypothetical protein
MRVAEEHMQRRKKDVRPLYSEAETAGDVS